VEVVERRIEFCFCVKCNIALMIRLRDTVSSRFAQADACVGHEARFLPSLAFPTAAVKRRPERSWIRNQLL